MNRPNIVFYFSDQQRWDTLGCYGQKLDVTPNLDQLAQEGTRFDLAFTMQPVCGPARACLQSGRYATEIGCWRNSIALPENVDSIARHFHAAGYDTAYIGKWHLASNVLSNDPVIEPVPESKRAGYQYWMASDLLEHTSHGYNGYVYDGNDQKVAFVGYRPDCINNFAIDYLHNRNSDNPFFLFISQIEPHHQNDHGRYEGPDGSKEKFKNYEVPGDLEGMEGDWAENYPDYLGCCNSLDQNVGRLIDTLKEQGLWENTILIYTSDHGSHFKTRNFEYKRSCHEASLRVPLIACGGVFNGGKVISDIVSTMDLPVTLLDLAGIEKPAGYQGHSLAKLVRGDKSGRDNVAFAQISESQIGRCIRTERWKYSVRSVGYRVKGIPREMSGWMMGSAKTYYEDFLYDLENDPHEKNNLVDDPAYVAIRAQLKEVLIRKMQEANEPVPEILPYSQRPADVEIDREQLMRQNKK